MVVPFEFTIEQIDRAGSLAVASDNLPSYSDEAGIRGDSRSRVRQEGETEAFVELDFIFVQEQKVVLGECKAGPQLGERDIGAAEFAASLGAAQFVFATTSVFTEESISMIDEFERSCKSNGMKMEITRLMSTDLLRDDAK